VAERGQRLHVDPALVAIAHPEERDAAVDGEDEVVGGRPRTISIPATRMRADPARIPPNVAL
jgi:hypothetical protein